MEKNVKESKLFGIKEDKDASWGEVILMRKDKEKAFDEKVKRFNMWTFAVFLSVSSSIITTLVLLAKLGVLR